MVERAKKINSLIKKELGKIIFREVDFGNNVLITITRVDTSSNIIQSKIYISVIPENMEYSVMNELNKNIYQIQQKLNKILRVRPVLKIIFKKEKMTIEVGRVEELLRDENKENTAR